MAGETNTDITAHMPTAWSVPFIDVVLCHGSNRQKRSFILDTGAQITFISTPLAQELGIDLAHPETNLEVVGAGTCSLTISAYRVNKLIIPTSQNVALAFRDPLVYVLDVPGIDGGIGSNMLFNFEEYEVVDIDLAGLTLGMKLNVVLPPAGDATGDGLCSIADLQLLAAGWATVFGQPGHNDGADLNCDGYINVGDLQLLIEDWGKITWLAGDCNGDGTVNAGDLQLLVAAWGSSIAPLPSDNWNRAADCNSDGHVNVGDLQVLIANWGRSLQ